MPKNLRNTPEKNASNRLVYTFELPKGTYACDVLGLLSVLHGRDPILINNFCADFATTVMVEQELFQAKSDVAAVLKLTRAQLDMKIRAKWEDQHATVKMTEAGVQAELDKNDILQGLTESLKNAEYQHRLISTIKTLATEKYNSLFTNPVIKS